MDSELTGAERRHLRTLGHELEAVVQIGHKGVGAALTKEINAALEAHELIKVKLLRYAPLTPEEAAASISASTGAEVAQVIGRVVLLYREASDPERRHIHLRGAPPRPKPEPERKRSLRGRKPSRPRAPSRTSRRSGRPRSR